MPRSVPMTLHRHKMETTPGSPIGHLQWSPAFERYIGDAVPRRIQAERERWYHWWEDDGAVAYLMALYPVAIVEAVVMAKETGDKRAAARTVGQSTRWLDDHIRRMQWDARSYITGTIE